MRQVAAAVIVEKGRLFLARRSPSDHLAGYWELPGGKIELGETPEECLTRELAEELNMGCEVGRLLATTVYHYRHGSFEMLAYKVRRTSDHALLVHDACAWVGRYELGGIEVAPADVELLRQLEAGGFWD